MLLRLISLAQDALSTFFSKPFTMDSQMDSLQVMLGANTRLETDSFLSLYRVALVISSEPTVLALHRLTIGKFGTWKCEGASEHEFDLVNIVDKGQFNDT